MIKKTTIIDELTNENNRYMSENDTFILSKLLSNLLFSTFLIFIFTSVILIVLTDFIGIYPNLTFSDLASLCLGNTCFYYSFRLIKEKVIPYYTTNPIFLIGIVYPAFFNSTLLNDLLNKYVMKFDVKTFVLVLSIIIYYLIINKYYQSIYQSKKL